jgi:hypothetical protein
MLLAYPIDEPIEAGNDDLGVSVAVDHIRIKSAQAAQKSQHGLAMTMRVAQTPQRFSRLLPGIGHWPSYCRNNERPINHDGPFCLLHSMSPHLLEAMPMRLAPVGATAGLAAELRGYFTTVIVRTTLIFPASSV